MHIDIQKLKGTVLTYNTGVMRVEWNKEIPGNLVGSDFSPISGLGEAGEIHGRAVESDPASGSNVFTEILEQAKWVLNVLSNQTQAFEEQERGNTQALDSADLGEAGWQESFSSAAMPEAGTHALSYVQPFVNVGADLTSFHQGLIQTKSADMVEAAGKWSRLKGQSEQIVSELNNLASSLESDHDSEFTESAARRIRALAASGEQFSANASNMHVRASQLGGMLPTYSILVGMDVATATANPDPATKKAFETAVLMKWQTELQNLVSRSLPDQQSLIDSPGTGTTGGSIEVGMGGIAGNASSQLLENIVWPREVQDAIDNGDIGAGSFGVVDGELAALEHVDPRLVEQVQQVAQARNEALYGGGKLHEFINNRSIGLDEASTAAAGTSGLSGAPIVGGEGSNSTRHGMGTGSLQGVGSVDGNGTLGPGRAGIGGGASVGGTSGGIGGASRAGFGGRGGFGGHGGGITQGGIGDASGRAIAGDGAGRGQVGSPSSGGVTGQPGGGGQGSAQGRGTGPMFAPGAAGRGQEKKTGAVKSLTTRVEENKNRRDLLGDPKPALPGPIGDWVRE